MEIIITNGTIFNILFYRYAVEKRPAFALCSFIVLLLFFRSSLQKRKELLKN